MAKKKKEAEDTTDYGTCAGCGGPLRRAEWNTVVDILRCYNLECKLCDRPVGTIKVGASPYRASKAGIPEWLKGQDNGSETPSYQVRLQRLWSKIHAEDEETKIP